MSNSETSRTPNRIHIHESVMPIYRALTHGQTSDETGKPNDSYEQSPFSTYRDLFLLAACCGYRNHKGRREPLPRGKKNTIRMEVFGDDGFNLLKTIAIAETSDVTILQESEKVLTISEEYAHLGVGDLERHLLQDAGHSLWNLISQIKKES